MIAIAPIHEMRRAAAQVTGAGLARYAKFAFTGQGERSLRKRLLERIDAGADAVIIVPLIVPINPASPTGSRNR